MKEETMELKHYAIAAAALAAFSMGAQAQTTDVVPGTDAQGNTIIIVTPPDADGAPGSAAVFTPMQDPSRPMTRAEVKAETRNAVRQGDIPRGELGQADQTQHLQPSLDDELHRSARP
jgi:hypothetical protein